MIDLAREDVEMEPESLLYPWFSKLPLERRERLRISALVFTDIVAFAAVMSVAVYLDRINIAVDGVTYRCFDLR